MRLQRSFARRALSAPKQRQTVYGHARSKKTDVLVSDRLWQWLGLSLAGANVQKSDYLVSGLAAEARAAVAALLRSVRSGVVLRHAWGNADATANKASKHPPPQQQLQDEEAAEPQPHPAPVDAAGIWMSSR